MTGDTKAFATPIRLGALKSGGASRIALAALLLVLLAALASAGCAPGRFEAPQTSGPPRETALDSRPGTSLVRWTVRGTGVLAALVSAPQRPKGALILLAGGDGRLGVTDAGEVTSLKGNFLIRASELFVKKGFAVALVDRPTDQADPLGYAYRLSREQAQDAALVLAYLRSRWKVPVAVAGNSLGSVSAVSIAARLGGGGPDAVVLTSSLTRSNKRGSPNVLRAGLGDLAVPVLVVHNRNDACPFCPFADTPRILDSLARAPRKELAALSSTEMASEPCQAMSPHGYLGIEEEAVEAITGWMLDPKRGPGGGE